MPTPNIKTVVMIPSHSVHERNAVRLLHKWVSGRDLLMVSVRRVKVPAVLLFLRNFFRQGQIRKGGVFLAPRLSDAFEIDGCSTKLSQVFAGQLLRTIGTPDLVVVGEKFGEVALLQNELSGLPGTLTTLIPEGLGVGHSIIEDFWSEPSYVPRLILFSTFLGEVRTLARRLLSIRNTESGFKLVLKSSWKLERLIFLMLHRSVKSQKKAIDQVDYVVSEWRDASNFGVRISSGQFIVSPSKGPTQERPRTEALFLHGPYDVSIAAWTSALRPVRNFSASVLIKPHRNRTGLANLVTAAEDVFAGQVSLFDKPESAESLIAKSNFPVISAIDSTVLVIVSNSSDEGRVLSVLDSFLKGLSKDDFRAVDPFIDDFKDFKTRFSGILKIV